MKTSIRESVYWATEAAMFCAGFWLAIQVLPSSLVAWVFFFALILNWFVMKR